LFLVGISSHFSARGTRIALLTVALVMLAVSVVQLLGLPQPPGGL
jgi:hypothetical protein